MPPQGGECERKGHTSSPHDLSPARHSQNLHFHLGSHSSVGQNLRVPDPYKVFPHRLNLIHPALGIQTMTNKISGRARPTCDVLGWTPPLKVGTAGLSLLLPPCWMWEWVWGRGRFCQLWGGEEGRARVSLRPGGQRKFTLRTHPVSHKSLSQGDSARLSFTLIQINSDLQEHQLFEEIGDFANTFLLIFLTG